MAEPTSSAAGAKRALVTDGDRGSALSIVRSLGRGGWRVFVADPRQGCTSSRSKYTDGTGTYPAPEADPAGFVSAIEELVRRWEIDLVLPITDDTLLPLARERRRFEGLCRLAIAEDEALAAVLDKTRTLELARRLEVPIPNSVAVRNLTELGEALDRLSFPLVLKPSSSRLLSKGKVERFSVVYANNADEARRRFAELGAPHVLLQEYCTGEGRGVELLAECGQPRAAFQHRRLAETPPTGGASAWRESMALDPELYDYAARLVRELRWSGLVMVEFKVGERTRLMEINGRVWGSLPLAVKSGMDFPLKWAEMCMRQTSDESTPDEGQLDTDYRIGVRAYNPELFLPWMANVLLRRHAHPDLPYPARRSVGPALKGLLGKGSESDFAAADDPAPAAPARWRTLRKCALKLTGRSE